MKLRINDEVATNWSEDEYDDEAESNSGVTQDAPHHGALHPNYSVLQYHIGKLIYTI